MGDVSGTVLAVNGVLQPKAPLSAAQMLKSYPRGAYTALSATGPELQVSGWDLHCERLAHSLQRICSTANPGEHGMLSDLGIVAADDINSLVAPSLRAAALAAQLNSGTCAAWKVAVLLFFRPQKGGDTTLAELVSTAVHVGPMASGVLPPAILAVSGPPRSMSDAKDSRWATERAPLEAQLPANATEGLLCTPNGRALEGFVNNFFVVLEEDGQEVIQTAAAEDGILDGIMRRFVLQACAELGLRCILDAPSLGERQRWREACVTNSVSGVRPVSKLISDGRLLWESWELDLHGAPGSVTQRLQEKVKDVQQRRLVSLCH